MFTFGLSVLLYYRSTDKREHYATQSYLEGETMGCRSLAANFCVCLRDPPSYNSWVSTALVAAMHLHGKYAFHCFGTLLPAVAALILCCMASPEGLSGVLKDGL